MPEDAALNDPLPHHRNAWQNWYHCTACAYGRWLHPIRFIGVHLCPFVANLRLCTTTFCTSNNDPGRIGIMAPRGQSAWHSLIDARCAHAM